LRLLANKIVRFFLIFKKKKNNYFQDFSFLEIGSLFKFAYFSYCCLSKFLSLLSPLSRLNLLISSDSHSSGISILYEKELAFLSGIVKLLLEATDVDLDYYSINLSPIASY